jgi:mitogen-activated protein kinase 1/3
MEDYYGIKSRRAREYIRSLPFKKKIPFRALFPKSNDQALDLLEKLLAFNPAKRISVEDALRHPYLEPYHDPEDEPTAPPIPEGFFDFDKNKDSLSKEQLKCEFWIYSCFILSPWIDVTRWNHLLTDDIYLVLIYEEIMR